MELVIASNNKHKVSEIKKILSGKFDEIYSLADLGIEVDPKETASDFLENARIKARTVGGCTDKAVVADDSGLEGAGRLFRQICGGTLFGREKQ